MDMLHFPARNEGRRERLTKLIVLGLFIVQMAVAIWLITTLWPPKSCEDRMSGVECAHEIQRL